MRKYFSLCGNMNSKIILATLLCTILTVHSNALLTNARGNFLDDLIGTAISAAKEKLNELTRQIEDQANKTISKATTLIDQVMTQLNGEVENIENKALKAGINITFCTVDALPELSELPPSVLSKIVECVSEIVQKAEKLLADALKNVESLLADATALLTVLGRCGLDISCLTDTTHKITAIPGDIANTISGVVKDVTQLLNALGHCVMGDVNDLRTEGQRIVDEIKECVNDLINNATTEAPSSTSAKTNLVV